MPKPATLLPKRQQFRSNKHSTLSKGRNFAINSFDIVAVFGNKREQSRMLIRQSQTLLRHCCWCGRVLSRFINDRCTRERKRKACNFNVHEGSLAFLLIYDCTGVAFFSGRSISVGSSTRPTQRCQSALRSRSRSRRLRTMQKLPSRRLSRSLPPRRRSAAMTWSRASPVYQPAENVY